MSGIYLTVWDPEHRHKSPVLFSTKGGWPHITLVYTGKHLSKSELVKTATQVFQAFMLETVFLVRAEVNSFEDRPGHMRHDVLLITDRVIDLEQLRKTYLRDVYPDLASKFAMRTLHVTHGIYEDKAEAESVANRLNQHVLPYSVQVIGVTID